VAMIDDTECPSPALTGGALALAPAPPMVVQFTGYAALCLCCL
jgi:hypothetical protein